MLNVWRISVRKCQNFRILFRKARNPINVVSFTHTSGAQVTVFEHGAGDTSVGVIFFKGELRQAGTIDDLAIGNCTLFAH